jgi:hypothetical protein
VLHDACRMVVSCHTQAVKATVRADSLHSIVSEKSTMVPCPRLSSTPTSVGRNTRAGSAGATMATALGLASSGCDSKPSSVAMASASSSTSCGAVRQQTPGSKAASHGCSGRVLRVAYGSDAGHSVHRTGCSGAPQDDDAGWRPGPLAAPQLQWTPAPGAAHRQSRQCGRRCGSGQQWWTRRLRRQQRVAAIALTCNMTHVAGRRRSCSCAAGHAPAAWAAAHAGGHSSSMRCMSAGSPRCDMASDSGRLLSRRCPPHKPMPASKRAACCASKELKRLHKVAPPCKVKLLGHHRTAAAYATMGRTH